MRRSSGIVTFFIFLIAIAINCQQATQITSAKSLSQTPIVNATEFSNKAADSQLVTAEDDADEIPDLQLVETGISDDDLGFLRLTVSKAVLHYTHAKQPTVLRL